MQDESTHARTYCNAKTRSGGKCKNAPLNGGNGRCRMHNGRAKGGMESPTYKDGRHSKYLPYPLADIYNEARNDEQLLSVKQEIALADTLIMAMLPNLETGESGQAWRQLSAILGAMRTAYAEADTHGMADGFNRAYGLINDRLAHYKTQDEILRTVDQRRKLVETEQRISLQGERAITIELFGALLGAIFGMIEAGVKDKDERISVLADIRQLVS